MHVSCIQNEKMFSIKWALNRKSIDNCANIVWQIVGYKIMLWFYILKYNKSFFLISLQLFTIATLTYLVLVVWSIDT